MPVSIRPVESVSVSFFEDHGEESLGNDGFASLVNVRFAQPVCAIGSACIGGRNDRPQLLVSMSLLGNQTVWRHGFVLASLLRQEVGDVVGFVSA